jgi:hypothetical protein
MPKLSTIILSILFVAHLGGRALAEGDQYYETVISTDKIIVDLTFDGKGNPWVLFTRGFGQFWLYRWVDDYWVQEVLLLGDTNFPEWQLSIDSMSFPHLLNSSTHVYKTDNGWQTEQLPFRTDIFNFYNPASPKVAQIDPSSLPDTLDIHCATKGPTVWQVSVSTIPGGDHTATKGFFEEGGALFLANIINNQLKIFKIDGPSTEIVLDMPVVGSLLGFERDSDNQFHILTSSQNISYPPLSVSEGFSLKDLNRTRFLLGTWNLWSHEHLGLVTRVTHFKLSGSDLFEELVPSLFPPPSLITGRIFKALVGDSRPYYLGRVFKPSGETPAYPTLTAKLPPPAPVTVSARTTGSIRWAWAPRTSEIVTGYRVRRGGDNADLSGLLAPTVNSWTLSGFSPNTQSTVYLETIYPGFVLPSSPLTAASAGVRPGSVRLDRGSSGRLSAAWSAEGNPNGIQYRVDLHAPDGTVFSQMAGSPNHVFPSLTTQVPYALNVTVLSSDGSGVPLSTVDAVEADGRRVRMEFTVDGVTVEAVILPVGTFLSPILAAAPVSTFPTGVADGLTPTGRGFQLEMDHSLPEGQSATVSVVYPAGWLDATVPEPWVLARYDSAHGAWIALPTRREGQRLTASVDGFGTFQVMGRPAGGGGTKPLTAYPNPFRLSEGASLVVREVPPDARALVMAMDGRFIRSIPGNETGLAQWDGTDGAGEKVKSGVYVISVEHSGETKKIKVIVER